MEIRVIGERAYHATVSGNRSRRAVKKLLARADAEQHPLTYFVQVDNGQRLVAATEAWDVGLAREWERAMGIGLPELLAA
jgi:hypothetical protein